MALWKGRYVDRSPRGFFGVCLPFSWLILSVSSKAWPAFLPVTSSYDSILIDAVVESLLWFWHVDRGLGASSSTMSIQSPSSISSVSSFSAGWLQYGDVSPDDRRSPTSLSTPLFFLPASTGHLSRWRERPLNDFTPFPHSTQDRILIAVTWSTTSME